MILPLAALWSAGLALLVWITAFQAASLGEAVGAALAAAILSAGALFMTWLATGPADQFDVVVEVRPLRPREDRSEDRSRAA